MDPTLGDFLALAFARAPAREANACIAAQRDAHSTPAKEATSYEVLVPEGAAFAYLTDTVLPRLVYHLESKGLRPPKLPGVFLSVFFGDTLYFLDAARAIAFCGAQLGLTDEQLVDRFGTKELRVAMSPPGPPLALPGPKREDE